MVVVDVLVVVVIVAVLVMVVVVVIVVVAVVIVVKWLWWMWKWWWRCDRAMYCTSEQYVSQTRSGCTNQQQALCSLCCGSKSTHSADIMTSGCGESERLDPPQYKFPYHKAYVG